MKCLNDSPSLVRYSVCTLVTNHAEYREMVDSFKAAGFSDENSEFLYIDNSETNHYDAFSGLNLFLSRAIGKYIIIVHQDVLLRYDTLPLLEARMAELDRIDPSWGVLGNAGFFGFRQKFYRISDPWGENVSMGPFPARVETLDENFLLIKQEANLALSRDLSGFHMYGADLCTIASMLGWSAYVIDFHLYHKSGGNCNESFQKSREAFIAKYAKTGSFLALRTTCTILFVTPFAILNRLLNRKLFYSLKKRFEALRALFK